MTTHDCADCTSFIAMTLSYPGGWQMADTPEQAVRDLKSVWGSVACTVFRCHPETVVDEHATFIFPRGHAPLRLTRRKGKWQE